MFPDNREFKKITTETATAMSLNERFNEQKKSKRRQIIQSDSLPKIKTLKFKEMKETF